MDLQLDGRVAVVTGASKGIGLAIARTLAAEGMTVVAASRTRPDLEVDARPRRDRWTPPPPRRSSPTPSSATAASTCSSTTSAGRRRATGCHMPASSRATTRTGTTIIEFNLMTAVRFCRAALPILLERGGGSIVNVASVVGRQPAPMNLDYGAAKAAMLNLTKGLSEEFGAAGVRVNSVSPGPP